MISNICGSLSFAPASQGNIASWNSFFQGASFMGSFDESFLFSLLLGFGITGFLSLII